MKKILVSFLCVVVVALLHAQGVYMEMRMGTAGGSGNMNGLMKVYSQDGNSRSEVNMNVPGMPAGLGSISVLILKSNPGTIYMLNDKNKTYTEISSSSQNEDMKDFPQSDYEVTLIGKEKANNYNCAHVIVKRKGSNHATEMWTTTELDGYSDFVKAKTQYTGKVNMYRALEEKGAVGFPVRIKSAEHGHDLQIDLVKAEKRNNPATLFSLSGYTKNESAAKPGAAEMQEMMKKLQNMTPAEREVWMKKMQEQYSSHPH